MLPRSYRCVTSLAGMLFTAFVLIAQSAPPASSTPARSENSDVPLMLQEFSVTTSRTNDYVAAESITGTRIASKIIELPFNVNVATREFIEAPNEVRLDEWNNRP